jgi:oligopeptide/dipeptide ABC transporter ATP-binding protein
MPLLLDVQELTLSLPGVERRIVPVDGVSFSLDTGESVGLVGESGCGKSLSALTLLGLTRGLPGAQISGNAQWTPTKASVRDLLKLSEPALTKVRGGQIAMVFQDPLSSLNPLLTVKYQLGEVLERHLRLRGKQAHERAIELLALVGIPQPETRVRQYPHQLSGGLRQRVMLAMALAGKPLLLIADEPTTALDVTVQAQILSELRELMQAQGLAVLFITHDLGVVAQLCSRVLVMYAGRIVEQASARRFFSAPLHPYSQGLLASLPSVAGVRAELNSIPGAPPRPGDFPTGCRFHPRCPLATERCRLEYPEWRGSTEHRAACWEVVDG